MFHSHPFRMLFATTAVLLAMARPAAAEELESISFGSGGLRFFVDTILPTHEDFLAGLRSDGELAFQPLFAPAEPLEVPPVRPAERLFERGIASTYGTGDGFQGNRTACGQVFDTFVPQVAHKTLPCGTMVRVEDRRGGQSVVVEVTDRGPYISGRVVDLSWAAFRELDPSGPGLLDVAVYLLEE